MNLIEKLGIEKCRQIVDGAPENSQAVVPCLDGEMYFAQRGGGKWFRYSDGCQKWFEYYGWCDPMDMAIKLSELRTAIANHGTPTNEGADNFSHFDHCSDIRNHISPNTVVINLDAEAELCLGNEGFECE